MDRTLEEVRRIVASMDGENTDQEQQNPLNEEPEPEETYHIYPVDGGVFITKEELTEDSQVIDSTPPKQAKKRFEYLTIWIVLLCCIPMLASIAFQVYGLLNPPIATVTIVPKSQTVTLIGTLQLGRLINPITISQSQTVDTTGRGHQIARAATGYLTFYNGQFQSVTIAAGTILTGSDGIQIVTDQDATIPAGSPPSYGQVTVSAHAINTGSKGNVAAYDINQIYSNAVLVKNTHSFYGGVDARDFQTVTKADITNAATPLKSTVLQSMTGAFQGQLKEGEQLYILPCHPTVTSDHQPGQEAREVKVIGSETCSAVAYNSQELKRKATDFLISQAATKIGTGYSLFGDINVSVKQASVSTTPPPLVFLSFSASGEWIGLSRQSQQHIKKLIAGKTKDQALHIIASMPGVESASIRFQGFGDATRLPKNSTSIHIILVVM